MLILPSPFSTCASKRISIPNETHTDNASINNRAGFAIFVLSTISTKAMEEKNRRSYSKLSSRPI